MADITSKSRELSIMKFERDKLVALTNIQSKEIRKIELQEEIDRCDIDIEQQKKKIEECEENVRLQKLELAKDV